VSYNMTSRRWVLATANYNSRLEALNSAKNIMTIPKHPRALTEHLGAIEMKIASRIACSDFTCTAFTLLHRLRDIVKDAAASGGQKMVSDPAFSTEPDSDVPGFQRKTAICSRYQVIMYPGGADNHKMGYCTDGACQIVKKGDHNTLLDWPQPQGNASSK
jgi:hypothetical protein